MTQAWSRWGFPSREVEDQYPRGVAVRVGDDQPDVDIGDPDEAKGVAGLHWVAPSRSESSSASAAASWRRRAISFPRPRASRTCSVGMRLLRPAGGALRRHSANSCVSFESSESSTHQYR